MYINKLQKSGNSFYVTLPRAYIMHLGLKPKDHVVVKLSHGKIVLMSIDTNYKERLKCRKKK